MYYLYIFYSSIFPVNASKCLAVAINMLIVAKISQASNI